MDGLESFEEGELPPSPKAQSHHISKNRQPNIQAWQSLNNILQKTNLIKPAPTKLTQNANYAVTIGKSTKPKHISPVKPPTRPSGRSYSPVRLSTGDDYTDMLKNFKKVREHQRSRSTEDEKIRRRKYRDHPRNRHFSCTDYKETIDLTLSDSEPVEMKRPFQEKMIAKDYTRRQLNNVPDKKVFKWVNGELKRTAENKHTVVNACGNPKTRLQVKKKWDDLKTRGKKKFAVNQREMKKTGGGISKTVSLSVFEERAVALLGKTRTSGVEGAIDSSEKMAPSKDDDSSVTTCTPNDIEMEIISEEAAVAESQNTTASTEWYPKKRKAIPATYSSCIYHQDIIDIERRRLAIEEERLAIEKRRLSLEDEKFRMMQAHMNMNSDKTNDNILYSLHKYM